MLDYIKKHDLAREYHYTAIVMKDRFEELYLKGELKEKHFPKGVLNHAISLFDLAVAHINFEKYENYSENYLRSMTANQIVIDAIKSSQDLPYKTKEDGEKLEFIAQEFLNFGRTLIKPIKLSEHNRNLAGMMLRFFKKLEFICREAVINRNNNWDYHSKYSYSY